MFKFLLEIFPPTSSTPKVPPFLCSASTLNSILSYQREDHILFVPLEKRDAAKEVFQQYLKCSSLLPRRHLLCTLGAAGSGKTVLQAFNLLWFSEENPENLGVEITFNDDQGGGIWNNMGNVDADNFKCAVAIRILHRALAHLTSPSEASFRIKQSFRSFLALCQSSSDDPILCALSAVRMIFKLDSRTPILVTVDELGKVASSDSQDLSVPTLMTQLTSLLDNDFCRSTLFLSLTAYYASDVSKFATDSSRPILIQPLPPLLPAMANGLSPEHVEQLPFMLRMLADETLRRHIPNNSLAEKVLACMSELLQASGGHPRRLLVLLNSMNKFSFRAPTAPTLLDDLKDWLDSFAHTFRSAMDEVFFFKIPDTYDQPRTSFNRLVQHVAQPFSFPCSQTDAHACTEFLQATKHNLCQFIPQSSSENSLFGFAFLPLPILNLLHEKYHAHASISPSLRALLDVVTALKAFAAPKPPEPYLRGWALEQLAASSLSLFLLHNPMCKLSQLCYGSGDLFNLDLHSKIATSTIPTVEFFPFCSHRPPAAQGKPWDCSVADDFLSRLTWTSDVEGVSEDGGTICVFTPSNPLHPGAEHVFCLLPRADAKGFILLVVHCKDRLNSREEQTMLDEWRAGQRYFTSMEITQGSDTGANAMPAFLKKHRVSLVFVLFTTHPITASTTLAPNEAVIDFVRMRGWQPTTAFAAETVHRLRRFCRLGNDS